MNTLVTSKEALLKASCELIKKQGLSALNIRNVAAFCNVSIGTIYNYFPSKSDLIAAVTESVWCDIFHFSENQMNFDHFTDCVQWAFDRLKKGEEQYPGFLTNHSVFFMKNDKLMGEKLMQQSWIHIQEGFNHVLSHDKKVRQDAFDENFTPDTLIRIIFSLMISAMIQHNYECDGIISFIHKILYETID